MTERDRLPMPDDELAKLAAALRDALYPNAGINDTVVAIDNLIQARIRQVVGEQTKEIPNADCN